MEELIKHVDWPGGKCPQTPTTTERNSQPRVELEGKTKQGWPRMHYSSSSLYRNQPYQHPKQETFTLENIKHNLGREQRGGVCSTRTQPPPKKKIEGERLTIL